MDKKSITGLVLIAGILVIFAIFSPKPEQVENEDAQTEQTDSIKSETVDNEQAEVQEIASNLQMNRDEDGNPIMDSLLGISYTDTITGLDTFITVTDQVNPEMSAVENNNSSAIAVNLSLIHI